MLWKIKEHALYIVKVLDLKAFKKKQDLSYIQSSEFYHSIFSRIFKNFQQNLAIVDYYRLEDSEQI